MLTAPPAAPRTPSVTFLIPRQRFTITWNEPELSMSGTVDAYFVNISGPNDLCGNSNMVQRVTERSYTCTIQRTPQQGDIYNITVAAANCGGNLRGPESDPVHLQGMIFVKRGVYEHNWPCLINLRVICTIHVACKMEER